jgi:hypothetical protein
MKYARHIEEQAENDVDDEVFAGAVFEKYSKRRKQYCNND